MSENYCDGLGYVVMLGCSKFDDAESYVAKFAEIFRVANIRSITVVEMAAPCCAKLPLIVRAGLAASGKGIPLEEVVVSRRGNLMHKWVQILFCNWTAFM